MWLVYLQGLILVAAAGRQSYENIGKNNIKKIYYKPQNRQAIIKNTKSNFIK